MWNDGRDAVPVVILFAVKQVGSVERHGFGRIEQLGVAVPLARPADARRSRSMAVLVCQRLVVSSGSDVKISDRDQMKTISHATPPIHSTH